MKPNIKKLPRLFFIVVFGIALINTLFIIITPVQDFIKPSLELKAWKQYKNYFLEAKSFSDLKLLVNTTGCKIPDIETWETSVVPLVNKAVLIEDCWKDYYHWSYVDKNEIVLNETAVKESGYAVDSLSCCYQIIKREEQPEDNYDKEADNLVSYSKSCFNMEVRTRPQNGEYFMVVCKGKTWKTPFAVLYRQFHSIARPHRSERTIQKISFWQEKVKQKEDLPPSIVLIGIDSTSRINFRRNMFKTHAVLQDLGAVEMLGYTKVGSNTFPNFVPTLNGYSEEELVKICYFSPTTAQDDCPLIWKRLEIAQYLTAHAEDSPAFTGFNYEKTGFRKQPVDYYLRPLMVAAHENSPDILNQLNLVKNDHIDCVGYKQNDEVIVDYMESAITMAHENKTPIFAMSWSTTLTHGDLNNAQLIDVLYAEFLQRLQSEGKLDNTILLFMSDHGYRYGKMRETLSGWYEEKLPLLWIYLPERIKEGYPHWEEALEINSRLLTSNYNIYWTIHHILDTFTKAPASDDAKDATTGEVMTRKFRNNFFQPVAEDLSCEEVGVPEVYCACYPLQSVDTKDPTLTNAAKSAISNVNMILPDVCSKLSLQNVTGGAMMDKTTHKTNKRLTYVVAFTTQPGDFLFEAEIDFYPVKNVFSSSSNMLRTSKMNTDVSCIRDPHLELFCYCTFLNSSS